MTNTIQDDINELNREADANKMAEPDYDNAARQIIIDHIESVENRLNALENHERLI